MAEKGSTPLHFVAAQGRDDIVSFLLGLPGITVDVLDAKGRTVCIFQCWR